MGNLLDNALEAAVHEQTNRRVSLVMKDEDNWITLCVSNTGAMITDEQLPMLFVPGYTTKDLIPEGLVCILIKNLVDSYRGRITVIRKPETTFIVSLPKKKHYHNKPVLPDNLVRFMKRASLSA